MLDVHDPPRSFLAQGEGLSGYETVQSSGIAAILPLMPALPKTFVGEPVNCGPDPIDHLPVTHPLPRS